MWPPVLPATCLHKHGGRWTWGDYRSKEVHYAFCWCPALWNGIDIRCCNAVCRSEPCSLNRWAGDHWDVWAAATLSTQTAERTLTSHFMWQNITSVQTGETWLPASRSRNVNKDWKLMENIPVCTKHIWKCLFSTICASCIMELPVAQLGAAFGPNLFVWDSLVLFSDIVLDGLELWFFLWLNRLVWGFPVLNLFYCLCGTWPSKLGHGTDLSLLDLASGLDMRRDS